MAVGMEVTRQHAPKPRAYRHARPFDRRVDDFKPFKPRRDGLDLACGLYLGFPELGRSAFCKANRLANPIASPALVGIPMESAAARAFDPGLRSLRGCREHRCDLPHNRSYAHHSAKFIGVANSRRLADQDPSQFGRELSAHAHCTRPSDRRCGPGVGIAPKSHGCLFTMDWVMDCISCHRVVDQHAAEAQSDSMDDRPNRFHGPIGEANLEVLRRVCQRRRKLVASR